MEEDPISKPIRWSFFLNIIPSIPEKINVANAFDLIRLVGIFGIDMSWYCYYNLTHYDWKVKQNNHFNRVIRTGQGS